MRTSISRIINNYYLGQDNFVPYPATIAIRLTYRCNLRCTHCGLWGKEGALYKTDASSLRQELDPGEWKRFIDDVARFRPYIYFTGGEPLLYDGIFGLIKHASSKGLITRLGSNCTLLSSKADELVRSGLAIIFSSLDGPPGINETIRIGRGSSEHAVAGLEALKDARKKFKTRLPIIRVQTVITNENHGHLLEMAHFINDKIDAEMWVLMPGIFTTAELVKSTQLLYKKLFDSEATFSSGFIRDVSGIDTSTVKKQVEIIKNSKWRFKFYLYEPANADGFDYEVYFRHPEYFIGNVFCPSPFVMAQLLPNGDVATCSRFSDYVAGNIRENNFLDIWNGQKYKKFRELIKRGLFPICTRCSPMYNLLGQVRPSMDKVALKNPLSGLPV
jgi:radical SAM protein with 4Fe4S-binding SPASM domain